MSSQGARPTSRAVAADVICRVETTDAYANLLLPKRLSREHLTPRDAAFVTELVYGTLRNQGWYDTILARCASRPVAALDPQVRALLRMGAHQVLDMRVPVHAAIGETVATAKQTSAAKASGFINAVLRRVSERTPEQWESVIRQDMSAEAFQAVRHSHPVWIARALGAALAADGRADELDALLTVDSLAPRVSLVRLPGVAETTIPQGYEPTEYSPLGMYAPPGDPSALSLVGVRVQDQGSQLAALALSRALPVEPGQKWLDACAGPGGKAAVLLAEGAGRVQFDWNEVAPHRAALVRDTLRGILLPHHGTQLDARALMSEHPGHWDRILVDAPCSGLGAIRRRPESRWRKSPADLPGLTALQAELIDAALTGLAPGGVLAYVTCSPHLAETQRQVESALRRHPGVRLLDTAAVISAISPGIPLGSQRAGVQLWPHIHHSDAMFISLMTYEPEVSQGASR